MTRDGPKISRLNKMPIIMCWILGCALVFVAFMGSYYISFEKNTGRGEEETPHLEAAANLSDQITKNMTDGIVSSHDAERADRVAQTAIVRADDPLETTFLKDIPPPASVSVEENWREKLKREQDEEFLREEYRQKMRYIQSTSLALSSPIEVDLGRIQDRQQKGGTSGSPNPNVISSKMLDLYGASLKGNSGESNLQDSKEAFLKDRKPRPGYLPSAVVGPLSPFELKRGSLIPATLITGINSDLPGNITAQVSQNVYDSATGKFLLIPQGSKLLGKYDSRIAYGQSRVLIAWTDVIFPDGATLQINGMAGTDPLGYGGFKDQVDNHYAQIFGSAILVSLIGTGMDLALPKSPPSFFNNSPQSFSQEATDAARRSFVEGFGRVAERTITKNMDIQPTLEIRPGYLFNVLVDQDIVFPKAYGRGV
jgi:type IV secretion system protein TrbI